MRRWRATRRPRRRSSCASSAARAEAGGARRRGAPLAPPGSARALAERLSDLCEPIEAALHELNAAHAPSIERGDGSRGTGSF